jgi:hypothetical protein
MDKVKWKERKEELKAKISHLITLLEVVPVDHPKFIEYNNELDKTFGELHNHMVSDRIKEEVRIMKSN